MPKMTFIQPDGTRIEVEAPEGLSVLEVAHRNKIDLEGACEGSLACSTCHIVVAPEWYDKLTPASDDEEDMLDLAFGLTSTSRLGCQIIMNKDLDGLTVTREVRADAELAEPPIVVITALGQADHERQALEAGATRYLRKPFDVMALRDLIAGYLRG